VKISIDGPTTTEWMRPGTRVWFQSLERGAQALVFHDIHTHTEGGMWKYTYCGVSTMIQYAEQEYDLRGVRMPVRHARKIGRPCKKCWP
jgi:hypothetical protein